MKYIQTLLVCAIENEEIDLPVVLEHYYQALGLDAFVASLEALLDQLAWPSPRQGVRAPDLWCQYKEVMEEIGIGLDFVSSDDLEFEIPDMALGAIVLVHWDIANDGRNEKARVRLMNQAVIEFMRMHELCSVPFGSEVAPSLAQIELQEWLEGSGDYA
ncbi:MAG: hypothetical protein IPL60_09535 [Ardenticatenia bacterium]|nr:hypothetical protein [Ardenticatenia bacterium]